MLVDLSEVEAEEVKWLWEGRIALGKLTLIVGDPGEGKSFLTLDLSSRVSRGIAWPDGNGKAPLGGVVLLSGEDDIADTIKPRLVAAGADCTKIRALRGIKSKDSGGDYQRELDLQRDLDVIEQAVATTDDCRLLIVDPIGAYLGKTDSHNNAEVRGVLAPLSELASKYGAAVVAVHHFRKSEGAAKHRVTGSLAFTAAARSVWAVTADRDDQTGRRKLFVCVKNNLAIDKSGLAFSLHTGFTSSVPSIEWEANPVTISADDALAPKRQVPGPEADERAEAEAFLETALADGPRPATDVIEEAREVHGISKRTLDRAKKRLRIESVRDGSTGPWNWRLSTLPTTLPLNSCHT